MSFDYLQHSDPTPTPRALPAVRPPARVRRKAAPVQIIPIQGSAGLPRRRHRRRWGVWLCLALLVLAGLFVVANLGSRAFADRQVASSVKSRTGAQNANVKISSWAWLVDLLGSGTVSSVQVSLQDVPAGPVDLSSVTVDAHDVHVARNLLLDKRQLHVTKVGFATVTATISAPDLSQAVGHPVVISGSEVDLRIGHKLVPVGVSVSPTGVLSLALHGATVFKVALSTSRIVPSCPMHLFSSGDSLGVSCRVAPVPPSVIEAIG